MQPEVNRMAPLRNLITSPPPVIDIVVQYDLVIGTGLEHTAVEETQNCARDGTGRNLSILVNAQIFSQLAPRARYMARDAGLMSKSHVGDIKKPQESVVSQLMGDPQRLNVTVFSSAARCVCAELTFMDVSS